MTSLWKKLQMKRTRRSPSNKKTRKNLSGETSSSNNNNNTKGHTSTSHVPLRTISVETAHGNLVSPLKSSPTHHYKRMSSSALTDTTQSSHSFSEENDLLSNVSPAVTTTTCGKATTKTAATSPTNSTTTTLTASTATTTASDTIIPPRPSRSHWKEEDFLRVVSVWDLSQEEIYMMRELEAKLYDVTHWKNNPFEVVRFMKGPQGYKPAERLFRKMIQWRIDNNVDTILEDYTPPPVLMDYCPSAILYGLDHDGDPIYLERAGATDAAGLLTHFGHKALIRHVIWLRELCGRGAWIKDHEERMGRPITRVTIVYDLAGLNARHLRPGVLPLFAHMMRLTQDNYTGPVKRMIIIRAPAIFRYVWAIAKNFFDPWAVAKMTFTGPDDAEEKLSRFMDLEVLPPCVSPKYGKGRAAEGMPQRFEGGIPPSMDYSEPITQLTIKTMPVQSHSLPPESSPTDAEKEEGVKRGSITTSLLGSGFFTTDDQGDVLSSGFFHANDGMAILVDPLA